MTLKQLSEYFDLTIGQVSGILRRLGLSKTGVKRSRGSKYSEFDDYFKDSYLNKTHKEMSLETGLSIKQVGGCLNRLNVCFLGMVLPGEYIPSYTELIVSLATVSAILFLYTLGVKLLPVYEKAES